jgi:beta-glucosidase/6-phospho-beta-glucosidase/beta-galactosidase
MNVGTKRIPLMAGFECSTHRRSDGTRVDVVEGTRHVENALTDYQLIKAHGMTTVRDGLRWHIIEPSRSTRDWSSFTLLADAAEKASIEVIWDLLHFGFPDWVNPFHPDFPAIFADFAADFARRNKMGSIYVPVNEISFFAWAAGDVGYMYPYSKGRGPELKYALCAASIAATAAIKSIDPSALIVVVEPMIAVRADVDLPNMETAERLHEAQFEAVDMLLGLRSPELGGSFELVDIVGLNHYPQSQWRVTGGTLDWQSADWTPPSILLEEIWNRYQKPLLIAETGAEGVHRAAWFDHIVRHCDQAAERGVSIMGVCLYPILSHQAWTGERHCPNGLFDGTTPTRAPHLPLLEKIRRYQQPSSDKRRV